MSESATHSVRNRIEDIEWIALVVSVLIALVPAFGLYVMGSIATGGDPIVWLLPIGLVVFAYSAYGKETTLQRAGSALFWLAMEAFLAPIAILGYAVIYTSEQAGVFEQAGAAIGGAIMFGVTWLVAWFAGIVLYLISRRLEG